MKVISVLILAFALVAAQNVTETKATATKETGSASVSSSESQVVIITTQPVTATASVSNSASQEVSTTYPYTTTSYSQSESHSQVLTKTFSASESHSSSSSALTASTFTSETHASTVTAGSTFTTVAPVPTSAAYPDLNGKWTIVKPNCPVEIFDTAYQVSNLGQVNNTVYLFTAVNASFAGGLVLEDAAGNFVGFSAALAACKGSADVTKNTGQIVCVQGGVTCTAELSRSAAPTAQPTANPNPSTTTATAITATESHIVAVPNIAGAWDVSNLKGPEADKVFDKKYTVTGPSSSNYTIFTFTAATPAYGQGEVMESADGSFVGVSGKVTGCHGKIDVNAGKGNIICNVAGTDLTAELTRETATVTHSETISVTKAAPTDNGAAVIAVSFMLIAVALF